MDLHARAWRHPADLIPSHTGPKPGVPQIGALSPFLSSEPKCNTPADLIIGTVDQDLRECCHAMLFAFVG